MKSANIRQTNEKILLKIMHERGVVTQTDLARETGLQPSTIFRIFKSMENRNVIRQTDSIEPSELKQGRRPGYFELNPSSGYSIGIDLSQSTTAILLVDFQGNPVKKHAIEFPTGTSAPNVIDHILDSIEEVLISENIDRSGLLGVGIGAPGVIDIERGEVIRYSRVPGMEGLPIQRVIMEHLDIPVFVHNNASVIALAENRFGRAAEHGSVVAFLIRSGIGGAFIKERQIYTSQGMTAFEVGHMTLNARSRTRAQREETLEDILSENALIDLARKNNPKITGLPDLVDILNSDAANNSKIHRDFEAVSRAFNEKARNVALMLNPEAFIIIARHITIARFFAIRLEKELAGTDRTDRFNVNTVIPLEYDQILACRGAAELVFDNYFCG